MIEHDTIRLLRECDAGIKMGISSIEEVIEYTGDKNLRERLQRSVSEHEEIKKDLQNLLDIYHDEGKEPNVMAKGMSWIKTNVKLAINESDNVIADLITDGCDMGVKSLSKYLNQYEGADEKSKDLAKKLIKVEEKLGNDMREYL
ncbi:MAG: hypothetical protein PUB89_15820 [Oscillospiraceae bacterium]|nr:hypothetical protein [Oscillospiraceae bacterium]